MFRRLSLVALSLLAVAAGPKEDTWVTQSTETYPIGEWAFRQVVEDGKMLPAEVFRGWRLTIGKSRAERWAAMIEADQINRRNSSFGGWNNLINPIRCTMDIGGYMAIYRIEKGILTICVGKKRPTDFTAHQGSGRQFWSSAALAADPLAYPLAR